MEKKKPKPKGIAAPPLETLVNISRRSKSPYRNYQLRAMHNGDKLGFLKSFANAGLPNDLGVRAFGNVDDLFDVQANASTACQMLNQKCVDLEGHLNKVGQTMPLRTAVAAHLVIVGAAMVTTAYILHLRPVTYTQGPALSVLRSGLEAVGRGGWVAFGKDDEPTRIQAGGAPTTAEWKNALAPRFGAAPGKTYAWLCNYTHLDYAVVMKGPPANQDVYAAAAYVAWLAASMTDLIVGHQLATPPRLPTSLPW